MNHLSSKECCGYAAAFVSCVAFGSFAVPIKSRAVQKMKVDPLVLQTYKIGMCFLTSWLVLLVGVPFTFTPWGLVSGLFMVPGGTAGYYAVKTAGLAISQGIWSSLKVLVAFGWGIFVFQEPVRSRLGATLAIVLLMLGLMGMSYFASASVRPLEEEAQEPLLLDAESGSLGDNHEETVRGRCSCAGNSNKKYVGLLGAVIDGAYGGSVLVPMHYAGSERTEGLGYLISFGIGCSTVVSLIWLLRFLLYAAESKSWQTGWERLPSFHLTTVGPYAATAGLIWSIGNLSSILTVAFLGQGVGYSIVQSQLLVAGLWGALFYGEIRGRDVILRWFLFALVTVVGIVLLSSEHAVPRMSSSTTTL